MFFLQSLFDGSTQFHLRSQQELMYAFLWHHIHFEKEMNGQHMKAVFRIYFWKNLYKLWCGVQRGSFQRIC